MKIRPLSDVVVVELEPEKKITTGGIIVPDSKGQEIRLGRVLSVGPGKYWGDRFVPTEVKEGDRAVFFMANLETKQGSQLCHVLGDNLGLIRETDILFCVPHGVDVRIEA